MGAAFVTFQVRPATAAGGGALGFRHGGVAGKTAPQHGNLQSMSQTSFRRSAAWHALVAVVLVVACGEIPLFAQDASQTGRAGVSAQGFAVGGPGWLSQKACDDPLCQSTFWTNQEALLRFGGGVDLHVFKGLGATADVMYLQKAVDAEGSALTVSLNGTYFLNDLDGLRSGLVPFVTAGYTGGNLLRRGVNVGAGAMVWGRQRAGLRVEARAHWGQFYRIVDINVGVNVRRGRR